MSRWLQLLAFAALASACQGDLGSSPFTPCEGQECGATSRDQLLGELDGFADPFAEYLRANVSDRGSVAGDYRDLLDGVGQGLGCGDDTERSFVVLSNMELAPKVVFTRCSESPADASRFFLLAPNLAAGPDIDPRRLHMASWDDQARRYRHYATEVDAAGELRIGVQPDRCLGCHGGPENLPTWQPLMNEMTNPWSQWNAEPGFASHFFDDYLDPAIAEGDHYREMTSADRLGSASDLEPLVRAAIDRVVAARIETRRDVADVDAALELLRPVFCDENSNYVSEVHRSGEIRSAAVVDDALRSLLESFHPGRWTFASESTFRLELPDDGEQTAILLPVRGQATVEVERGLLSRRVLTATDVLRVRALDFAQPVNSAFRCQLFHQGAERVRSGVLESALAALPEGAVVADLAPSVFAELLKVELPGGQLVSLDTSDDAVIAVDHADSDAFVAALDGGDVTSFERTTEELGDILAERLDDTTRSSLLGARQLSACSLQAVYLTAPIIPGLDCP